MADIDNVINVTLLPEGEAVARDNMNVVAVLTSQQTGPLSSANRSELYSDSASVGTDDHQNHAARRVGNHGRRGGVRRVPLR